MPTLNLIGFRGRTNWPIYWPADPHLTDALIRLGGVPPMAALEAVERFANGHPVTIPLAEGQPTDTLSEELQRLRIDHEIGENRPGLSTSWTVYPGRRAV